ncbi:MAG TPA: hypothetical protein VH081_09620 [Solirubrobacteraceae bacterium]|nr:hypothetical protein [Solirubrobacteraceae bacterium]
MLGLLLVGCGSSTSKAATPAAQKLEREDLAAASRALQSVQAPVSREVSATKAAWPLIANGLPADVSAVSSSPAAARAALSAAQLPIPKLFSEAAARTLTGPASQIAGLYRSYALLSTRGWRLLYASLTQIESGTPAAARFARANAALYIESIYDAHFTLAQIGKKLTAGYEKLGGSADFDGALTRAQVDALARTYSEASDRLHPHVALRLGS